LALSSHARSTGKLYVITGGAGFIGSRLANALLAAGDSVRILHRAAAPAAGLIHPACEFIVSDLSDAAVLRAAMAGASGCFHLATNAPGVLAAAGAERVPVVLASSAAVYGPQPDEPAREDAPLLPQTPYGREKLAAEQAARAIHEAERLPTLCLRFFNIYGPGQIAGRPLSGVVANYMAALAAGRPLEVEGDGRQKRDFLFVDDAIAFLRAGMEWLVRTGGHEVLNACTGRPVTILALAAAAMRAAGVEAELSFRPRRSEEILWSYGNPEVARSLLGVSASVGLEAGLHLTCRAVERRE